MDVSRLVPGVTDDRNLAGAQFHSLGAVMVFKPVVHGKPAPANPLGIHLLVNEQAAFTPVWFKRVVLTHDHFQLPIPIQVSNGNGMWRTDLVDDVHLELPVARTAGILQPADGREERLVHVVIDILDRKENIRAAISIHVSDRYAANGM